MEISNLLIKIFYNFRQCDQIQNILILLLQNMTNLNQIFGEMLLRLFMSTIHAIKKFMVIIKRLTGISDQTWDLLHRQDTGTPKSVQNIRGNVSRDTGIISSKLEEVLILSVT